MDQQKVTLSKPSRPSTSAGGHPHPRRLQCAAERKRLQLLELEKNARRRSATAHNKRMHQEQHLEQQLLTSSAARSSCGPTRCEGTSDEFFVQGQRLVGADVTSTGGCATVGVLGRGGTSGEKSGMAAGIPPLCAGCGELAALLGDDGTSAVRGGSVKEWLPSTAVSRLHMARLRLSFATLLQTRLAQNARAGLRDIDVAEMIGLALAVHQADAPRFTVAHSTIDISGENGRVASGLEGCWGTAMCTEFVMRQPIQLRTWRADRGTSRSNLRETEEGVFYAEFEILRTVGSSSFPHIGIGVAHAHFVPTDDSRHNRRGPLATMTEGYSSADDGLQTTTGPGLGWVYNTASGLCEHRRRKHKWADGAPAVKAGAGDTVGLMLDLRPWHAASASRAAAAATTAAAVVQQGAADGSTVQPQSQGKPGGVLTVWKNGVRLGVLCDGIRDSCAASAAAAGKGGSNRGSSGGGGFCWVVELRNRGTSVRISTGNQDGSARETHTAASYGNGDTGTRHTGLLPAPAFVELLEEVP